MGVHGSLCTGYAACFYTAPRRPMAKVPLLFPQPFSDIRFLGSLTRLDCIRFLKNLKLVAVDELHYYHSIFGRSVHMVTFELDLRSALTCYSAAMSPR